MNNNGDYLVPRSSYKNLTIDGNFYEIIRKKFEFSNITIYIDCCFIDETWLCLLKNIEIFMNNNRYTFENLINANSYLTNIDNLNFINELGLKFNNEIVFDIINKSKLNEVKNVMKTYTLKPYSKSMYYDKIPIFHIDGRHKDKRSEILAPLEIVIDLLYNNFTCMRSEICTEYVNKFKLNKKIEQDVKEIFLNSKYEFKFYEDYNDILYFADKEHNLVFIVCLEETDVEIKFKSMNVIRLNVVEELQDLEFKNESLYISKDKISLEFIEYFIEFNRNNFKNTKELVYNKPIENYSVNAKEDIDEIANKIINYIRNNPKWLLNHIKKVIDPEHKVIHKYALKRDVEKWFLNKVLE